LFHERLSVHENESSRKLTPPARFSKLRSWQFDEQKVFQQNPRREPGGQSRKTSRQIGGFIFLWTGRRFLDLSVILRFDGMGVCARHKYQFPAF
jgi:hypothetical protein